MKVRDSIEVLTRQTCQTCKGVGIVEHELWTEFYREHPGRVEDGEVSRWFKERGYAAEEIPPQEMFCPDCGGAGRTERWVKAEDVKEAISWVALSQVGAWCERLKAERDRALLALADVLVQACGNDDGDELDSRCLRAYAKGVDVLVDAGLAEHVVCPDGRGRLARLKNDAITALQREEQHGKEHGVVG